MTHWQRTQDIPWKFSDVHCKLDSFANNTISTKVCCTLTYNVWQNKQTNKPGDCLGNTEVTYRIHFLL